MTENYRYHFLDCSRGLAAFVVLLAHTIKTFSPGIFNSSFSFIWDSEAAVLYFFILSGFVLTESIRTIKLSFTNYCNFALKRFCRIYPAFIVVLIFSFLLYPLYSNPFNGWLSDYWKNEPNAIDIIKQAVLIKRFPNDPTLRILPHDWTLSIEILISLALPFLVLISNRISWLVIVLVYLMVKTLPIDTFLFDFAIGVLISVKKEILISAWKKINFLGHSFILTFAFLILQTNKFFPEYSIRIESILINSKTWGLSLLLISLISSDRIQKLLTNNILIYQGKISYSFYLVHLILIGILFKSQPELSLIPALLLVFPATVIVSVFLFNFVEKPWIQVGKKCFSGKKGQ